ncbi:MAG: hypothetical protein KGH71_06195, partial [Candidatus Micrarchaeota archaeon]|nr:hypothetical protein [Candidatus Micrarchaeota archaeon]
MFEGIVTCVKHAATLSENIYWVTSIEDGAAKVSELRSGIVLHLGDMVKANLVDGKLESAIIEDSKEKIDAYRAVATKYAKELAVNSFPSAVEQLDKVTDAMRPKLKAAASLL